MLKRSIILFLALTLTGCAKLAHVQELLTLKAYSDDQNAKGKYAQAQDQKFDKMLAAVKDGSINKYTQKKQFVNRFGDPVFTRMVEEDGKSCEQWLYRYAFDYFNSDKVYLCFDQKGKLTKLEYVPAPGEKGTRDEKNN